MSKVFNERSLQFHFGNSWTVEKYDEHADYRNRIAKLQRTKAVDFVGVCGNRVYFIEVKDFRGHRIENKAKITSGKLAKEVAIEVRDSIAGILGAFRTSATPDTWEPFAAMLTRRGEHIMVLLWLEEDRAIQSHVERQRRKAHASTLANKLKQACEWLTPKALIVNMNIRSESLPDLEVSNLPGAGQT